MRNGSSKWSLPTCATVLFLGLLAAACACSSGNNNASSNDTTGGSIGAVKKTRTAGEATPGGSLVFCVGNETTRWDPAQAQWLGSGYIVANSMIEPLFAPNDKGEIVGYLADGRGEPNTDFTEWKIKIREGITFHNGKPLDGEAVRRNLEATRKGLLTQFAFKPIDSISAAGNVVTVKMNRPWSTFTSTLTAQPGYIIEPDQIDGDGASKPIGTGPFKFVDWKQGSKLRVKRNDNYWRKDAKGNKLPYLDNIDFNVLLDFKARGDALESGQCDAEENPDPDQIIKFQRLAEEGQYQMFTDDSVEQGKIFITLNSQTEPFNDPLAREIFAVGVDTKRVSSEGFRGLYPPSKGPLSETSPNFYQPPNFPKFDFEVARKKHDEYIAKYGHPLKFEAIIPPVTEYLAVAQLIKQMGDELGIESNIKQEEIAAVTNDLISGKFQASGTATQGRILFNSPNLDGDYAFLTSDVPPPGGISLNLSRHFNQTLKDCLDSARTTTDPVKIKEANKCAQEQMANDLGYIWLVNIRSALIYSNFVFGLDVQTLPSGQIAQLSVTPYFTEVWKSRS